MKSQSVRAKEQAAVRNRQATFEGTGAVAVKRGLINPPQLQKAVNSKGMGGLQLPFVQEREPLEEAMRRMRSLERHALVVGFTGPDYRLYMNRSVMDAYGKRVKACSELRHFEGARVALFGSEAGDHETGFSELSVDLFKRHSADYALLSEPGASDFSVYVLTRTNQLAQAILKAVAVCYCGGGHEYGPSQEGEICIVCNTVIECT
jgi:hypothetical protein